MGVCYSQQQQWQAYKQNRRNRARRKGTNKTNSIIYQQKSIYQSSFASNAYASFRDDLHQTISSLANESGDIFMGSLVQMRQEQLEILYKSLHKINQQGELHQLSQPILLCNLKTKNYLHTHKIKHPDNKNNHDVSCCPYTSNHIPEYDIWKFIKVNQEDQKLGPKELGEYQIAVYIYHPFTQKFLVSEKGAVMGGDQRTVWRIQSFGPRRNGGFVKVVGNDGELCMTQSKGLLDRHRKVTLCNQKHVSHIWEIMFVNPEP